MTARRLPVVNLEGEAYFFDFRLSQLRKVDEPQIWRDSHAPGRTRAPSLGVIFAAPYRRVTSAMIVLSFCTLYAYWAFNFWVPAYLSLPVDQRGVQESKEGLRNA